jgi:hypothetical protein
LADAHSQTGGGLAIRFGKAAHRALTDAFTEGGDNLNLLVLGKDIHGANP